MIGHRQWKRISSSQSNNNQRRETPIVTCLPEKKLDKDQFEAFLLKNKNKIYKQINKSKKDIQKKFCSESKLNDHLFFDICIKKTYTNDKEFWGKFEQMKLKFEKDYKDSKWKIIEYV